MQYNIAALHAPGKFHFEAVCFFMCNATKTIRKMWHETQKKIKIYKFFFMLRATFLLHETNNFKCCTVEPLNETFLCNNTFISQSESVFEAFDF